MVIIQAGDSRRIGGKKRRQHLGGGRWRLCSCLDRGTQGQELLGSSANRRAVQGPNGDGATLRSAQSEGAASISLVGRNRAGPAGANTSRNVCWWKPTRRTSAAEGWNSEVALEPETELLAGLIELDALAPEVALQLNHRRQLTLPAFTVWGEGGVVPVRSARHARRRGSSSSSCRTQRGPRRRSPGPSRCF